MDSASNQGSAPRRTRVVVREEEEYVQFRDLIIVGDLRILKNEFIHVLYKLYMKLLRTQISKLVTKKETPQALKAHLSKILPYKKDFNEYPKYIEEIIYIEGILKEMPTYESMRADSNLGKILSSNFTIYLTRYAYEVLITIMERKQLKTVNHLFFDQKKRKIFISNNLSQSAYVASTILGTSLSSSEIEAINNQPYHTGLNRDDYIFMSKLEDLYIKKITKDQRDTKKEKEALAKQLKEKKEGVKIDENLLGKRGLSLDMRKYQVDKNTNNFMFNGPEVKLRYKIEYSKDYLDRIPIDDQEIEPDIIKLSLNDANDKITCVESNLMMKVVIVGCSNGSIIAYYLAEDSALIEEEEVNAAETGGAGGTAAGNASNNAGATGAEEQAAKEKEDDDLQKFIEAKPEDFEAELKTATFMGHSCSVTSLSVNFDSSYFVSGSVDSTVRLWNLKIGYCLAVFKAHIRTVWAVKLSSKGFYFLSGGADSIMFLWATNNSSPVMSFTEHTNDVTLVDFTENLNYVCSASLDRTFRVWNLENSQMVRILFFDTPLTTMRLSSHGDLLVVGTEAGKVQIWNLVKPVLVSSFYLDKRPMKITSKDKIRSVSFTIDERYVVISSKHKLAYYSTVDLKKEKSKSVFDDFRIDLMMSKKKREEEREDPTPINFFKDPSLNLLYHVCNSRNVILAVNKTSEMR